MEIPASCRGCFEKQLNSLERAGTERRVVLCPLLAVLALESTSRTPPIERHFLNLSEDCAAESHGAGPFYTSQLVEGLHAVEAYRMIKMATDNKEAQELAA